MAVEILSKYVMPGSKVDIRVKKKGNDKEQQLSEVKIYQSQIYDVVSEDRIEIVMPMERTKLVLLPIGMEYELSFYTGDKIYQCRARVVDREIRDNIYLLVMELTSNLRKEQRREYYRFSCALEMNFKILEQSEAGEENIIPKLPVKRSIIVDISGGGLRFVTDYQYEVGSIVLCKYQLDTDEGLKIYEILGKVLSTKESENRSGVFEHRIQYIDLDKNVQEEIIKFIFEEERKTLKNMRKD